MITDLLTTILRDTSLSRRLLDLSALSDNKALRFPCDRSIGLHIVLHGPVHIHAPDLDKPLTLDSGDIVVMARGCSHTLSTRTNLRGQKVESITVQSSEGEISGTRTDSVLSGAYQFWHTPLHPFFVEMPAWSVLRASDMPRLGPLALTSNLLAEELRSTGPGTDIVIYGLLDVVFAYALRQVIARCTVAQEGWSQAVHDPQIGRVVALMHEDPAHDWTLDKLAKNAGLSRTSLAERFRNAMGDTPLNHLRIVRMQRAIKLLAETNRNLETVATAVGYQDAFSFSKVFKRTVGMSPKAFRELDSADKQNPWRFQAT